MSQLQQALVQLERAKHLICDEIQQDESGKFVEALKALERIRLHLLSEHRLESLPHSL
ncbi:MAG TPA: hypothetical protein VMD08_06540 [Candidatus Baltobacteraceae bacterium]|nr:hypothetical protein [Candidatus Baltobacteraceae bacterium]